MLPPPPSNLSPREQKATLQNTAIRYLSFRPRFKTEIIGRLAKKAEELNITDPFTLINQIIAFLEKSRFLDDDKLLASFIRSRLLEKRKGPFWIRQKLLRLGLPKYIIDTALKQHAPEGLQIKVITQIIAKKTPLGKLDLRAKAKLYRSLLSRGFPRSLIMAAFDEKGSLG